MNFKDVKALMQLFHNSELTELEWKNKDEQIILKKEKEYVTHVTSAPHYMNAPQVTQYANMPAAPAAPVAVAAPAIESAPALLEIKSPMVGTFYGKPSPDSEPYLKVGSRVSKGQVVCIIEAMKLMNEVESDVEGTVVEICVKDSTPVEYSGVLFKVKP